MVAHSSVNNSLQFFFVLHTTVCVSMNASSYRVNISLRRKKYSLFVLILLPHKTSQVYPALVVDVKSTYNESFAGVVKKAGKKLGVDPASLSFFIRGKSLTLADIGSKTVLDCDVHAGFAFKCFLNNQPLPECLAYARKDSESGGKIFLF